MGLRVQLGHPAGERCMVPYPAPSDFTVIHVNGLHRVNVDYCKCMRLSVAGVTLRQQLMRRQWYPATHINPQTVCTLQVIKHYTMQTLQGKIAAYDYYAALEKLTDNVGLVVVKVCRSNLGR